ncbi:MAG: pirin family protein, partial [Myxococcota bacterium]
MSWAAADQPKCRESQTEGVIETVIKPRPKDIGAFEVRRCLPSSARATVGPFVFFDEMGPAVLPPGIGLDVRPHPHINLATLTSLFDGAIHHR